MLSDIDPQVKLEIDPQVKLEIDPQVKLEIDPQVKLEIDPQVNNKVISKLNIQLNNWIKWSDKSKNISFESNAKGIGCGEDKVGKELNTIPKGQNFCYDLDININNITYKADVKKLDKGTFNTGVTGRNKIRQLKNNLANLFLCFEKIYNDHNIEFTNNDKIRNIIKNIMDISSDEVCEKNIGVIKSLLKILYDKKINIIKNIKTSKIYDVITGKQYEENYYNIYKMLLINKTKSDIIKIIGNDNYLQVKQLEYFEHIYIDDNQIFSNELNDIKNIFHDQILIFVDKVKGYYIMTEPNLKVDFIRITRGTPRFKTKI
jgi:hypothetical protein